MASLAAGRWPAPWTPTAHHMMSLAWSSEMEPIACEVCLHFNNVSNSVLILLKRKSRLFMMPWISSQTPRGNTGWWAVSRACSAVATPRWTSSSSFVTTTKWPSSQPRGNIWRAITQVFWRPTPTIWTPPLCGSTKSTYVTTVAFSFQFFLFCYAFWIRVSTSQRETQRWRVLLLVTYTRFALNSSVFVCHISTVFIDDEWPKLGLNWHPNLCCVVKHI